MTSKSRSDTPAVPAPRRRTPNRPAGRVLALAVALIVLAVLPAGAAAHGPVAPVASSYLAKVNAASPGLEAKVIDGDQGMWLRVSPAHTVEILDYRGAPYLRFSPSGVEVNLSSAMYYLNQTPVPAIPPANLSRATPPRWQRVSAGHAYLWHDGRLHALATVALLPGATRIGTWRIPVVLDGRASAISGGLWHAGNPSLVWFWPIAVLLLCLLAGWRARVPRLDRTLAQGVALLALLAIAVSAVGRGLYGRPSVSVPQVMEMAVVLAFVAWRLWRLLLARPRPGYFSYFAVAFVALWEGAALIPTLLYGFVLIGVPGFAARTAAVLCLGCGLGLLLLAPRVGEQAQSSPPDAELARALEGEDDDFSKSLA